MPMPRHLGAKRRDRMSIGGNAVIRHVPAYHRVEPSPLLRDGLVAAPLDLAPELVQLRRHPPPLRLPSQEEPSRPRASADMREPEKVEGIRLSAKILCSPPWEGRIAQRR
jgi:hypothetical protein